MIGIQYFFGVGAFFLIGGINAMLIRVELLTPNEKAFPSGQYLSLVGLHGTMMIMMTSAFILGPFGNYFVPLMIGSRRMAFPRIEALTFWLTPLAGLVLMSAIAWNGFPTGWTGYAPLADEARSGMDAYVWAFMLIGISLCLNGLNLMATILTMRAPGLTWTRLPIFVWGVLSTSILMVLAAPVLLSTLLFVLMDRSANTSFYLASQGGSPYLYENLFWFFGHPEVYILALPGFGIVLEILPVFARKPLWGYRLAVAGMLGVAFLSFFVWQHHLFVSGINSTPAALLHADDGADLDSHGLHLPERDGDDLARTHALHGADAVLARVLLQLPDRRPVRDLPLRRPERRDDARLVLHDGPLPLHDHGRPRLRLLRRHLLLAAEDDRLKLNETLAKIHFWTTFVFFNLTFFPLFAAGFLDMVRRGSVYPSNLETLNQFVSASAFCLGASMLVFLANLIYSLVFARVPAEQNPWQSRGLEWQVPTPVPLDNFDVIPEITGDPYDYGVPGAAPVARLGPAPAPARAR